MLFDVRAAAAMAENCDCDLSDDDDDRTETTQPNAPGGSFVKLRLDSMLKEIEQNLPTLDDDSDFEVISCVDCNNRKFSRLHWAH